MGGAEGGRVAEVDGHRAQQDARAGRLPGPGQIVEIAAKGLVDPGAFGGIAGDPVVGEDTHPGPATASHRAGSQAAGQGFDGLSEPGGAGGQDQADQAPGRGLTTQSAAGPEGAEHLVVPGEDDPEIAFELSALSGHGEKGMGVDGGHGHRNHFEDRARVAFAQEHLEVARDAVRRLRIAHGRRFPEDKDAD